LVVSEVSFTKDGSIDVKDAPFPLMSNYCVAFGLVMLTAELVEEGKKYGWHPYDQSDAQPKSGLIRVFRSERAYRNYKECPS
jgi:hypothetical protein